MHWGERRVADNLHEAGLFHSVPGERLDGNDVEIVGEAARRAVERARQGEGALHFSNAGTFRLARGHVGSSFDLDVGVQRRGELSSWLQQDPIVRAEKELGDSGELTTARIAIDQEIQQALQAARRGLGSFPSPRAHFWSTCLRGRESMRTLTYAQAIREAHAQLLHADPRVFVIGQGLWSPWYAGSSLENLDKEFGKSRILDSPVSENAVTGLAVGSALAGMRPILFHPRMDFMLLGMDSLINQAANWSYLFGGQIGVPMVARAVINRGGEQGAQHSQSLHSFFLHVPGIKVVMPSTPADAKGLLIAAVEDPNPVLYIDDRWLYEETGPVEEQMSPVPIGSAAVRRRGSDVTLIGISTMAREAVRAGAVLEREGVNAEVIDLREPETLGPGNRDIERAQDRTRRSVRSGLAHRGGVRRNCSDDQRESVRFFACTRRARGTPRFTRSHKRNRRSRLLSGRAADCGVRAPNAGSRRACEIPKR